MFIDLLKVAVILLVDLLAVTTLAVMINKKSRATKMLAVLTVIDALIVSVLMLMGLSYFIWVSI